MNGLRQEAFAEGVYDVVRKNCNNFCDEFAFALVGRRIPAWVNRAASLGSWAGLGAVRGTEYCTARDTDGRVGMAGQSRCTCIVNTT